MLGFALPQYGDSARIDLARFASTAEELGAASLWVGDRLFAPAHPTVGYAGRDDVPEQFRTALDPFVALTVAATATRTATLGSSVLVAPWYPPVQLARQLTSIDVVADGRLLAGFGVGWSPEEYQAAGAPFTGRGAQLDELLDALVALWTTDPAEHEGARWSIPPAHVRLTPVHQPHPPIYLGAQSAAALRRIGRRADGWLPVVLAPGRFDPSLLHRQRAVIDAAAVDAGRSPERIGTTVRINVTPRASIDDVAALVRALDEAGYPDAFVDLLYVATDLDQHLEWVRRLLGA
ncbi:TIGR03619 family F420-dependent LLM class oxidoreductase [Pseudonocardia spinosispora]|uniref:TIGR03619 family F420-dependent LLM class oxidoreductase n=1 Tax=Pseudonocardia spinosispora TaxID=103441 RepID=UPI00048E1B4B|nr:TIGR03619 family F420-dependent LLM class oxidoreductase [Pseudonocardia spinosispora]